MPKFALVLTLLAALAGFGSSAKADRVTVSYVVSGTFGIPGLAVPVIGPPATGTAFISYTNADVANIASSQFGGFGAFTPLHATAGLVGLSLTAVPVSFLLFGDLFTASVPLAGGATNGPPGNLASTGLLNLNLSGGVSGLIHCTGATCSLPPLSLTPSVLAPFGFVFNGGLAGIAATPGSSLLPVFTLTGIIGTVLSVPVTATLTFTEAPLFGAGLSRHLVPEPGTAVLLGLGLVGIAIRRRLHR